MRLAPVLLPDSQELDCLLEERKPKQARQQQSSPPNVLAKRFVMHVGGDAQYNAVDAIKARQRTADAENVSV